MGAICVPGEQIASDEDRKTKDAVTADDTEEKFTKVDHDYEVENEQLKSELKSLKWSNDAKAAEDEEKTRKSEEVLRELGKLKSVVEAKDRAFVRARLEAALLSKAYSMLLLESKFTICKKGYLLLHYKRITKKKKWVELHLSPGEVVANDYKVGWVMMTYSNWMNGKIFHRCQILKVNCDESTDKDLTFTLRVLVEGAIKDVAFSCETANQKDEWITAINKCLAEVKGIYDEMHSLFTLKLDFSKETLGFRVEEHVIDYNKEDEKLHMSDKDDDSKGKTNFKNGEIISSSGKKTTATRDKVGRDLKVVVVAKVKNKREMSYEKEDPCELHVSKITDESLFAAGLQINCVLREINGIVMTGMNYSKQLSLLISTPKPYRLTFTGKKYLLNKPEAWFGYFPILKELVTDSDNSVKSAFNDLIAGTQFEEELNSSTTKTATIHMLLTNQRRLIALLRNCTTH